MAWSGKVKENTSTFNIEINGKKYKLSGFKASLLVFLVISVPLFIFGFGLYSIIAKAF